MIERMKTSKRSRTTADSHLSGQRGQSVLELALVVPFLSMILFGLIELGLVIHNDVTITNAARNGARVAALNAGSSAAVGTAVTDAAAGSYSLIHCPLATPSVSQTGTPPTSNSWRVTVSCTYTPITPLSPLFQFFGGSASSTYTVRASNTMKDSTCLPPCH
jgi:Flp pilus assembly protein TadG